MAKYDVYAERSGAGYFLDCQADLLGHLNTRLVVPLLPENVAPRPATRLNPVVDIQGKPMVMVTQFAAAIPVCEFGEKIVSLVAEQDAIGNALDMLITGF